MQIPPDNYEKIEKSSPVLFSQLPQAETFLGKPFPFYSLCFHTQPPPPSSIEFMSVLKLIKYPRGQTKLMAAPEAICEKPAFLGIPSPNFCVCSVKLYSM